MDLENKYHDCPRSNGDSCSRGKLRKKVVEHPILEDRRQRRCDSKQSIDPFGGLCNLIEISRGRGIVEGH